MDPEKQRIKEDEESILLGAEAKGVDRNAPTGEYSSEEFKQGLKAFEKRLKEVKGFSELYEELKDYDYLVKNIQGNLEITSIKDTKIREWLVVFVKNKKGYKNLEKIVRTLIKNNNLEEPLFAGITLYNEDLTQALKDAIIRSLVSESKEKDP